MNFSKEECANVLRILGNWDLLLTIVDIFIVLLIVSTTIERFKHLSQIPKIINFKISSWVSQILHHEY